MAPQETSNRLRELRQEKGIRLAELAVAADRDVSMIVRYEQGAPIPDDVKAKLAEQLGVTRAELMGWDKETVPA